MGMQGRIRMRYGLSNSIGTRPNRARGQGPRSGTAPVGGCHRGGEENAGANACGSANAWHKSD